MKTCRNCEAELPLTEFYNLTSSEDGKHPECKSCCKVNRALEGVRKRDKRSKMSTRQIHRARYLGVAIDEDIKLVEVFRRERGICYICKRWVQPRHASMDHEKPLSKGGTHTWDNVRLTHLVCNLVKGDRPAHKYKKYKKHKSIRF